MTGAPRSWAASTGFVMIHYDLLDAVGGSYAAAALWERIRYRSERDGWWQATREEMCAETRLGTGALRNALDKLRDLGLIESMKVTPFQPHLRWRVVWAETAGQAESAETATTPEPMAETAITLSAETAISLSTETEEKTTYTADAVEEVAMSVDQPLEGVLFAVPDPVPSTPPQTAQTLVARWVDGYRTSNAGQDPPGPLMRRVAGQAKNLAKACENDADWGAAWRASYSAGQSGHADAVPFMAAARSRYPVARNYDLEALMAQNSPGAPVLDATTERAMRMLGGGA